MEIHNPVGDTAVSSKRRKKRRVKKKATSQFVAQMDVNLEASKISVCEIAKNSLAEGSVSAKRKRKRINFKSKAGNNSEVKSRDQSNSVSCVQLVDKSLRLEIGDKLMNEGGHHTNQDLMYVETVNLTEGGQSYFMSKLQPSDTNLRQEICDKLAENVYVQHIDQNKVDTESTVTLAEGNVSIKRKKKRKRIKRKTGNNDELQSMDQSNSASNLHSDNNLRQEIDNKHSENEDVRSTDQKTMDIESAYQAGNNDEVKSRDQLNSVLCVQLSDKSLRLEIDYKLTNEGVQHTNMDLMDIETVDLTEGNMNQRRGQSHFMSKLQPADTNLRQGICDKLAENVDVQHIDQNKVDMESTVNLAKGNVSIKRKRKRIKRKTGNKDEFQSMDQSNSASNLRSDDNLRQEIDNKLTENEDARSTDRKMMDIESTYNLAEGNMNIKRKRRKKKAKSKHKNKDKVQSMSPTNDISNLQFAENNIRQALDGKLIGNGRTAQEFNVPARNGYKPCHSAHLVDMVEVSIISASSEVLEGKVFPCENQQKPAHNQIPMEDVKFQNVLNKVNNGLFVVEGTTTLGPSGVKEAECLSKDVGEYPSRPPPTTDSRKLLVLDVNGLLAYIVKPPPKDRKADINILRRAVFKRPFCDDFLKFCFQHFDVGIWSSRAKKVINKIVDYLLGNLKPKLLFCWNMSHSTKSGFKTLENIHKPLVCKELRKIWENNGGNHSWKKGQYNESNTLLIDDSPYKALLNPLHTAIFPHPYHYEDKDDNSLGPGGDLRVYLEGLLKSESVQEYVENHPIGQSAIDETNVSWQFYSGVVQKFSNKIQARNYSTRVVSSSQNVPSPPRDKVLDLEPNGIAHSTATPINTIDREVHPIHSSQVVSASQ